MHRKFEVCIGRPYALALAEHVGVDEVRFNLVVDFDFTMALFAGKNVEEIVGIVLHSYREVRCEK